MDNKKKFIDHLKGHVIEGELDPFSEQGSEGTHWMLYDDRKDTGDGYHRLHTVDQGDYLVVLKKDGSVFWEGTVKWATDTRHNMQTYLARYGTVHGLQEGMHPEKWCKMFFDRLPAYIIKRADS
jgi:hypothetical protein